MQNYVITIARGFGSGGKYIGTRLSDELNIPCYDREIITMASDKSGIDESMFVETDERLRGKYIANFLRRLPRALVIEPQEKKFISDNNLFKIQAEIIKSLAKTESCIIIGKCADQILIDYPNVLKVYIKAPYETCTESIKNKMHVSTERAKEIVRSTDKYRSQYYNYYSGGLDWTEPLNYDVVLNSDKLGREQCVETIKEIIKIKFGDK
ncbi:cytidylate kinase-like family protein [Clostridium sp. BJN0001]|uniref:cytidylate kinase-like family protein n=1 Tax=Clostridium sp. BJN0001 TaxID=2930219 RepID=UPI001FD0C4C3|nr:cytidylate kinase-like family protein [Clostridium sp. BJN0001]